MHSNLGKVLVNREASGDLYNLQPYENDQHKCNGDDVKYFGRDRYGVQY